MALKQEINNIAGVPTEYHRVSNVEINYDTKNAIITVSSYINIDKRDEEKEYHTALEKFSQLSTELGEIFSKKELTDEDQTRIDQIDKESEVVTNTINNLSEPRYASQKNYTFSIEPEDDFSLEVAYNWLKNNIFQDSEDV